MKTRRRLQFPWRSLAIPMMDDHNVVLGLVERLGALRLCVWMPWIVFDGRVILERVAEHCDLSRSRGDHRC